MIEDKIATDQVVIFHLPLPESGGRLDVRERKKLQGASALDFLSSVTASKKQTVAGVRDEPGRKEEEILEDLQSEDLFLTNDDLKDPSIPHFRWRQEGWGEVRIYSEIPIKACVYEMPL